MSKLRYFLRKLFLSELASIKKIQQKQDDMLSRVIENLADCHQDVLRSSETFNQYQDQVFQEFKQVKEMINLQEQNVSSIIQRLDAYNHSRHVSTEEIKINQGLILSNLTSIESKKQKNIQDYEFKVFSQWGEDGILQYLIRSIEIKYKTFIEFGVEDFSESNCRFLLMKDNWQGFVIDGSETNIQKLKNSYYYWKYDLECKYKFITKDNINNLLLESGFDKDLGLLSIDLDGNDYYILEAINYYQ